MTDPPSYDDDLLRRLNALKKSYISLDTESDRPIPIAKSQPTPETSLADRLKSLRNASPSSSGTENSRIVALNQEGSSRPAPITFNASDLNLENVEEDIKSLLSEIKPTKDWKPERVDTKAMNSLINEARNSLARDSNKHPRSSGKTLPENQKASSCRDEFDDEASDGSHDASKYSNDEEEQESHEAAEIISLLLDEIELEEGVEHINSATDLEMDNQSSNSTQPTAVPLQSASASASEDILTNRNPMATPMQEIDPVPEPEFGDDEDKSVSTRSSEGGIEDNSVYSSIEKRMAALRSKRGPTSQSSISSSTAPHTINLPATPQPNASAATDKSLNLPSVPSSLPYLPSTAASLPSPPTNALSLPSVPDSKPGLNTTDMEKKRGFGRAEEIRETWCVICSDDAKVACFGCGEDEGESVLYCARCWREGHLGEEVGRERRGHGWEIWRG